MQLWLCTDLAHGGDVVEITLDQFLADNADLEAAGGPSPQSLAEQLALTGLYVDAGGAAPAWALGTPFAVQHLLSELAAA